MINIYTVKWGFKYDSEHVNLILEQCKEHITTDFNFYCLTEHSVGLHPEVNVIPLPADNYYEKWWNKLYLFNRRVVRQQGEKLFLDLDIGIQNNIDCIVDHDPEDGLTFVRTHWHNMNKMKEDTKEIPYKYTDLNSSVLRWNDRLDIDKITKFARDYPDQMFYYYRGLDNLFGHQRDRLLKINHFPDGWVYSYNYGYIWPTDVREQVIREEPLICLYDSMERPQDVKL
jgi:hypothetical protein